MPESLTSAKLFSPKREENTDKKQKNNSSSGVCSNGERFKLGGRSSSGNPVV
jgi:hypothetical protein